MIRLLVFLLVAVSAAWGQLGAGEWKTDLSKKSIALSELRSGGPPKDGIPAILTPKFTSVAGASKWLLPKDPVIVVEHGSEARAYPLQILLFHEMVNDTIGDLAVLVTYCPLCNSAISFDRRVGEAEYTFGVSGMLRNSDMVMYDHQTDSLWQQLTGEALVGEMTGRTLRVVTSRVAPFDAFAESFPDGQVLSRQTGHLRAYGSSPYAGYEASGGIMFPVEMKRKLAMHPKMKMLTFTLRGKTRAYAFERLRRNHVVEGKLGGEHYVVFFEPATLSLMDTRQIADAGATGSAGLFSSVLDGERIRFRFEKGEIRDKKTGSRWNLFGKAVEGPLAGKQLERIEHGVYYAFAVLAFYPRVEVVGLSGY